jgi:serine/threonine-protein kinase HipA
VGRKSRRRGLAIWANGVRVGEWHIPASGPMELHYDPRWVASEQGRPLSLSLPFNLDGRPLKGDKVGFFFDNLLPDSEAIRQRIRTRFHTSTGEAFDLLAAIGRDCVGALQLLPIDGEPGDIERISVVRLDDTGVERLLRATLSPAPLRPGDEDDFRISIAGAQEKTALTWHEGHWCKPLGATPTTHILKLPLGLVGGRQMDMRASLENEWLCARLLEAYGVPVARSKLTTFGATKALVVERFDRRLHSSGGYWLRLPQEDFCQATGTPSSRKYEADGGPGIAELARILKSSETAAEDLATLFRAQVLFWLLAATDGHAKNFSLRLLPAGRFRLTPLYDVLSAWPIVGRRNDQIHEKRLKLAMGLRGKNKHYHVAEIEPRHFMSMAEACGVGAIDAIFRDIAEQTDEVIAKVDESLPRAFPEELFALITERLKRGVERW